MNKQDYWNLITKAVQKHPEDQNLYYEFIKEELSKLSYKDRYRFTQFTSEYLKYTECAGTFMLCKILNDYISDDTLLYFNLWVISRGKDFYLQVLANPDELNKKLKVKDKDKEFELFMSLGLDLEENSDAYTDETINSWNLTKTEIKNIASEIKFLNNEVLGGYDSIGSIIENIPKELPQLSKKFKFKKEKKKNTSTVKTSEKDRWEKAKNEALIKREKLIAQLEKELKTEIKLTKDWENRFTNYILPFPSSSMSNFTNGIVNKDTFLFNISYFRKKEKPLNIVGYNVINSSNTCYYESTEKMLYTFAGASEKHVYMVGNYDGLAKYEGIVNFYFNILIFDENMQCVNEIKIPCTEKEWIESSIYKNNHLYLYLRIANEDGYYTEHSTLIFNLNQRKTVGEIKGARFPLFLEENIFYLKNNETYDDPFLYDLYYNNQGIETLLFNHIYQFCIYNQLVIFIQKWKNNCIIKTINFKTKEEKIIFSLKEEDGEIRNLSVGRNILAFDIINPNNSLMKKIIVFYHLLKNEFRLSNADYRIAHSTDEKMCKIIDEFYYIYLDRLVDPKNINGKNEHVVFRGAIQELF